MNNSIENYIHNLLIIVIILIHILGSNMITISLLIGLFFLIFNWAEGVKTISANKHFFIFITLAILIGGYLYVFSADTLPMRTIQVWIQFFALTFCIAFINDKDRLLKDFCAASCFIFCLDIMSNLSILLGHNMFNVKLPPIRSGELMMRYPGFKGNALYSGSISLMTFIILLNYSNKKGIYKFYLFLCVLNLILAGSYRFFISLFCISLIYRYYHYLSGKLFLLLSVTSSLVVIILSFLITTGSNILRTNLWVYTFKKIINGPIWGIGFSSAKTDISVADFYELSQSNVTESGILTIGVCFGLFLMIYFAFLLLLSSSRCHKFGSYSVVIGLFYFTFYEWLFTGFMENLSTTVFFLLSMFIINNNYVFNNNSNIQQFRII